MIGKLGINCLGVFFFEKCRQSFNYHILRYTLLNADDFISIVEQYGVYLYTLHYVRNLTANHT